jgi:hypothetical protein
MSKQETDQARNVPPKPVALTVAETKPGNWRPP